MKTADLKTRINNLINATGPISIAEYMHLCNSDPHHGYYATGQPIGARGDFITAPEISQLFGEIIGLWCISQWEKLNCPSAIAIAEFGPGRGTLMNDILRTIAIFPQLAEAASIALIESSASLIELQQERLKTSKFSIDWYPTIDGLKALPTLIIANEFLDALPFRQFIKHGAAWLENCITYDESNNLSFTLNGVQLDPLYLPPAHYKEPQGSVFEHAPARCALAQQMGEFIAKNSGAGLLIDYGHANSGFGDTFQAVKNHKPTSPLKTPGECDLTSHVDFEAINEALSTSGITSQSLQNQSEFLVQNGLLERAGRLGAEKSVAIQSQITADVERLTAPEQMGMLFKACQFHQYSN